MQGFTFACITTDGYVKQAVQSSGTRCNGVTLEIHKQYRVDVLHTLLSTLYARK